MTASSGKVSTNIWLYLETFSPDGWLGLIGTILTGWIALSMTLISSNKGSKIQLVSSAFAVVFLHLIQRDRDSKDEGISTKMARFTSGILGFLVFSFYCSLLTSTMTTISIIPTITTFEDAYIQADTS